MPGLDLVLGGRQTTTLGPDMTGLGLTAGAGGGVVGPYPAPSGFYWVAVIENGVPVYEGNNQIVELTRSAA